jgi:phosphoribosylformylglycinamidine synthase
MLTYFKATNNIYYLVESQHTISENYTEKLKWLFNHAEKIDENTLEGKFIGPRVEMITPWSTNAVEICQNMGIKGITRIEEFLHSQEKYPAFDPMLQNLYDGIFQDSLTIKREPDQVQYINDIAKYNQREGLALSKDEIEYLEEVSRQLGRELTDSEVFGFSQVNSEHCRHKIFNGKFIIDGHEKEHSLFQLIKKTSAVNPNRIVSAYKDNVAFIEGPSITQFSPVRPDVPDFFSIKDIETVLSLKAETHNFPTTVEPFNGASTGSGGEIRDRMAGGKASVPLAGTAVYMTSYPRLEDGRSWEKNITPRKWLYQKPDEILIKASNGASDFGNKFGQPLICGSLLTFEHITKLKKYGYDKVIMLAGGVGFAKKQDSTKSIPEKGDKVIVMGGDNYRIGMGGGAVSSVATGEYGNMIELNAVQRANPEMQKRVANAVRAMSELSENPIISIHDHGAGGHLNCLSELVEDTGGKIALDKLPIGDPTLSAKEIVGNESQERMGLVMRKVDLDQLQKVADRERAPIYVVGEITGDNNFEFSDHKQKPIDLKLKYLFGKPPKTILKDSTQKATFEPLEYDNNKIEQYLENVLQLEAVACKDWLINKVDRCVSGKVAKQQATGAIQLPLNNVGVVTIDFDSNKGMATAIGHAPVPALIDAAAGSVLAIAESLTNLIWAPLTHSLEGVSLSANWMWPAKNEGENARLYEAVKAASDFAIALGINIPTGKDSLSMTQKYPDGDTVYSPGTVIISAGAEVSDIRKVVEPVLVEDVETSLIYIDFSKDGFKLGGSSFAQILNQIGDEVPTIQDAAYFKSVFNAIQYLITQNKILAGHDVSAGGLITALLEMTFSSNSFGLSVSLNDIPEKDAVKLLFSEKPGIIIQVMDFSSVTEILEEHGVNYHFIGKPHEDNLIHIEHEGIELQLDIDHYRDSWYRTSYLLDKKQTPEKLALKRFKNYKEQPLKFSFPNHFTGNTADLQATFNRRKLTGLKAAIIREKGINGDREMAYMMHLAGFDVKDVHMTDLISGRENLKDVNLIVFTGGFSNSDVLGSAKGWAGAFLYNPMAKEALDNFYARKDTLSLGVCNGCQLMVALDLIHPDYEKKVQMRHNDSNKFECAFVNVGILPSNSIMLKSLENSRLGIWIAHGEGKFVLPEAEEKYQIAMKYSYQEYPGNPNGSDFATAAICSTDGRHLAMMPHLERSFRPHHWPYYEKRRGQDEITPWLEAFTSAREWIKENKI